MRGLTYICLALVISVFIGSVSSTKLYAQRESLTRRVEKKVVEKADLAYYGFKYSIAISYYEDYLKSSTDPSNIVLGKLADCYWLTKQYEDAFRVYKLMLRDTRHVLSNQQRHRLSELYARFKDYSQASKWMSGLNGYQSRAAAFGDSLSMELMKRDSLNWRIEFLNVNTVFRDFSPFITSDGAFLFFSSDRPTAESDNLEKGGMKNYERLWKVPASQIHTIPLQNGKSNLYSNDSDKVVSLVDGLEHLRYNVGAVAVDKNDHYYFSTNYPNSDRRGINRLRLMEGYYTHSGSLKKEALPFGNPRLFSVTHPAINRDGTFLVLSSDEPNGKGNYDLYYTQRENSLEPWDSLKAFGSNINTAGNEVFPTLISNGYLYYSSDGLPGLGGLDIYRISLEDALDGEKFAEHLSYPINSSGDDFGWTQDSTTTYGYFSSDRLNYNDDLYCFHYINHQKMRQLFGTTIYVKTKRPISDATVFMWNKRTNKVDIAKTDKDGKYHFLVPAKDKVILKAVKKGMTNDCLEDESLVESQQLDTVKRNVQSLFLEKRIESNKSQIDLSDVPHAIDTVSRVMQNLLFKKHILRINESWKLNNIYYYFNRWDLRPDAKPILDSLIKLLNMYPIRVELGAHTDSRGTFEYNDWLSQKRAESVVDYLVKHGVDRNRLTATGYGKRVLINRCVDGIPCSEREHQINRRTEVRVISNTDIQKYQKDDIDPDQFNDGEQIDKSVLPRDFFDNCDKLNLPMGRVPSSEKAQHPNLKTKHRFLIRYAVGEFSIDPQYQYLLNELIRILSENPSIVLQITAQDDANDRSDILSSMRANLIRDYLVNKGISTNRCRIEKSRKAKSEIPYGSAVFSANNMNLDDLLMFNFIQSYRGDSKEMMIRNDNGNYCVQLGALKSRIRSQQFADKVQSIISVPIRVIEENSYFKIRTQYSINRNDAIETAAIIQATNILYDN